jgi:hypothetical protein
MQLKMKEDFVERLIFSVEATFHISDKVNRQQCPYLVNRATTYTDRTPV